MKRSEMLQVLEIVLSSETCENFKQDSLSRILTCLEKVGFFPPDSIPNDDGTITALWEPEEGWDEYLRFKEPPRTLPVLHFNQYTGKWTQRRMHEMAVMWNDGATVEEIANKFNVTNNRVETCLKILEREMKEKNGL